MLLYLDDDSIKRALVSLLRKANHDVQIPAEASLSGASDAAHLTHAITTGRTLLSYNYKDFEQLHNLIDAAGGHHAGILIIRRDNTKRDLKPAGVVRALQNLINSGDQIPDFFTILNHYR